MRVILSMLILHLTLVAARQMSGIEPIAPYLQAGTSRSMAVLWRSSKAALGRVEMTPLTATSREGPAEVWSAREPGVGVLHQLHVEGLQPATLYRYRCYDGDTPAGEGVFKTLPERSDASFRFAVLGDSGSGNANQMAVASALERWNPDFVLHTGDVIYERGESQNYIPRFVQPYRAIINRAVVYPTIGNHDHRTESAAPYLRFFEVPRETPTQTERWYSFRAGAIEFYALDTNIAFGRGSEQFRWLEAALARSDAPLRVAFFHHPPYSGGSHGSSLYVRRALGPLFERWDVRVVFSGHDHHYERSLPREDFHEDGRPSTYFVTGGGGAWLRPVKREAFSATARSAYHFLGVTVQKGREFRVRAIDPLGDIFDAWDLKI